MRFNDLNFSGHRHDGTHALHDHRHEVLHDRFFGQSSFGQYAVANERNVVKVRKDAPLEEGARLLLGGEPDGNVVPPHVFTDVDPASSIARDESFGPLLPIIKARDEAHALELANDTEFGLSSAVFTGANERGVRFALGIVAGMTHINDISVDDQPNAPFGGEKNSGLGRFNGEWAMEEFTRTQWITVQSKARPYPF